MNKASVIALFVCAAFLAGATSELIPDKKQKNPGRAAPVSASSKQDQSHDVHELEKISMAITHVGAGGPGAVTYVKGVTDSDLDGDGKNDEAVLRVVCMGGAAPEVQAWSWGATNSGSAQHSTAGLGHGRAAPGAPTEWEPATPQLALSARYLHKKLEKWTGKRMSSDAGGWTKVTLSGADGLCPAIDAVKATKSRSNIQNN
jgi:hypothetical protein